MFFGKINTQIEKNDYLCSRKVGESQLFINKEDEETSDYCSRWVQRGVVACLLCPVFLGDCRVAGAA